jgi:hypothetical protein
MADETAPSAPSAPAAPSAAPSSAPAPTTTTTSTSDVKRPANFGAALRNAATADSSSATPASGDSPAAGTVLPTDAGSTGPEGPVPYARFSEVNQHKKAAEEKLKALSWAEGIDHNRLLQSMQWHARAQQNPATFLREIYEQAPPQVQAQMRSFFVPPQAQRAPAAADAEPQPDIQTDTGVPVYSAKQQALREQWFQRKLMAEFQQTIAPLQQESQRFQQLRDHALRERQTHLFAQSTAKQATEWPHFQQNVKAVVEELQKLPPGDTEAAEERNLYRAYVTVLKRDVLPGLNGQSEQAVLADLKTKAVAGSAHPGRAGTSEPTRPKSMGDSLKRELSKAGLR